MVRAEGDEEEGRARVQVGVKSGNEIRNVESRREWSGEKPRRKRPEADTETRRYPRWEAGRVNARGDKSTGWWSCFLKRQRRSRKRGMRCEDEDAGVKVDGAPERESDGMIVESKSRLSGHAPTYIRSE